MNDARCPACLSSPCEVIDREITPHGLRTTFQCTACNHDWTVVF